MKKKLLSVLLASSMLLSLAACGNTSDTADQAGTQNASQAAAEERSASKPAEEGESDRLLPDSAPSQPPSAAPALFSDASSSSQPAPALFQAPVSLPPDQPAQPSSEPSEAPESGAKAVISDTQRALINLNAEDEADAAQTGPDPATSSKAMSIRVGGDASGAVVGEKKATGNEEGDEDEDEDLVGVSVPHEAEGKIAKRIGESMRKNREAAEGGNGEEGKVVKALDGQE